VLRGRERLAVRLVAGRTLEGHRRGSREERRLGGLMTAEARLASGHEPERFGTRGLRLPVMAELAVVVFHPARLHGLGVAVGAHLGIGHEAVHLLSVARGALDVLDESVLGVAGGTVDLCDLGIAIPVTLEAYRSGHDDATVARGDLLRALDQHREQVSVL